MYHAMTKKYIQLYTVKPALSGHFYETESSLNRLTC